MKQISEKNTFYWNDGILEYWSNEDCDTAARSQVVTRNS
jgi:hypothetical protein